MIRMLYISSAVKPMTDEELLQILNVARRNNAKRGISGMLLYCGDSFIQVLEGEEQELESLFKTIKKDPRHANVTILEKKQITERKFSEWSMGFKKLSDADLSNIEGLNRFFDNDMQAEYFLHEQNILALLMQHFRKKCQAQAAHVDLPTDNVSPLMEFLHKTIIELVKVLALLMVFVILLGVWDVVYIIYEKIFASAALQLKIGDILQTFGAFMAVLIAIEIFVNTPVFAYRYYSCAPGCRYRPNGNMSKSNRFRLSRFIRTICLCEQIGGSLPGHYLLAG